MKDDKKIVRTIMCPETGEITDALYEGDRIIRKESIEHYHRQKNKKEEYIEHGEGASFVKWFEGSQLTLGDETLTGNQWKLISFLVNNFRYDSGLVTDGNGNPLNAEDISELIGVSRSTCFKDIDILVKKEIILKGKYGHNIQFYVNPYIFCKGTRISKFLYEMFKKSKWRKPYEDSIKNKRVQKP